MEKKVHMVVYCSDDNRFAGVGRASASRGQVVTQSLQETTS